MTYILNRNELDPDYITKSLKINNTEFNINDIFTAYDELTERDKKEKIYINDVKIGDIIYYDDTNTDDIIYGLVYKKTKRYLFLEQLQYIHIYIKIDDEHGKEIYFINFLEPRYIKQKRIFIKDIYKTNKPQILTKIKNNVNYIIGNF